MPSSPTGLCIDCGLRRAVEGSKYCAEHQDNNKSTEYRRIYDRYRADDPIRLLYKGKNLPRWNGTRRVVFRRDPLCIECGHQASTVCDHHPLSAREIVERYGKDEFYNPARCRGLCKSCHDSKTATQDSTFAGKRDT